MNQAYNYSHCYPLHINLSHVHVDVWSKWNMKKMRSKVTLTCLKNDMGSDTNNQIKRFVGT